LDGPVNAYFESIFEVGVDEMLWDDMQKNDMVWPTVSEVHEYRKKVYEIVVNAIENHPSLDDGRVDQNHPMWALFLVSSTIILLIYIYKICRSHLFLTNTYYFFQGFEHERIHFETSSVLFRETPPHLVQIPEYWPPMHPSAYHNENRTTSNPKQGYHYPENQMIHVAQESTVDLGKPANFPSFGWDNEYGERQVTVPPFYASKHMITNGEFWKFVKDGGYRQKEYWCDDGWDWKTHRNIKWPSFWEQAGPAGSHEFALRTIFEVIDMPWDWPVDVNYYEAKAFCRWKTAKEGSLTSRPYRILTEAEHHTIRHREHNLAAARKDVTADKVMVTSGQRFGHGATGTNLNLAFTSQNPVDFFPPSQTGHYDSTGNAWEWTEDHFNPLKAFEAHHIYEDFSTPCFDGKHSMIVGGSFMSTGDEASVFARFHFRPHFLQHSGFRLVASDDEAPATHLFEGTFERQAAARDKRVAELAAIERGDGSTEMDSVYETEQSLHMYLGLHFPSSGEQENVPPISPHGPNTPTHGLGFPQRVVDLLNSLKPERGNNHALDIGCAVGGASFELAKTYDKVDAFDFSKSFVDAAKQMQAGDSIRFTVPVEGDIHENVIAVHEAGVDARVRSKIDFFTGDACKIREMVTNGELGTYDALIMSNLLCRLPDPLACLQSLPFVTNKGGVVVMVTPFSWLTEFTPRSKWLGGFYDPVSKKPIHSKDVLRRIMESQGFQKIHEEQMPLVIREHQRKYQYIVSEATGWRKIN
jgi:5-histidylcysteine sulfoxide synthase/putative 4-mercaptohistidine N1-methyltranferase